jgi:diacylglycerol kinase (ATP)
MNALFLVNDRSGVRRTYDIRAVIRAHWPHERCQIEGCAAKDDLDRIIVDAERAGIEVVFAVGGDGTVHEVARRLIDKPLTLGIVPIGSGNGFARHLGLAIEPAALLQSIPQLHKETIDTAEVNGRPFIGVMGVGFDAFIAERFASSTVRGMQTYIVEGISGYAAYQPQDYDVTIDGASHRVRAFVIAVANASQYGNNARIAPQASVQDGLLNVVIVKDAPLLSVPMMAMQLFSGSLHESGNVTTLKGREIVIRRQNSGPVHVDGEPISLPDELNVGIRPRSLNVLVPGAGRI